MRPRSPIEMMVDKACGFDPSAPPERSVTVVDRETQALMNTCDAAVAWLRQRRKGIALNDDMRNAERVLAECAAELEAIAWATANA